MDAYAHRAAIGRRFGARIAAGDAVFLGGKNGISNLPFTVVDGEIRQFSGVNRFMLLQVMKDQAWTDSRFFTVDQISRAGWQIAPDAKHVCLQFLVSTDGNGLPVDAPQSKRFHVFNASELSGVPTADITSVAAVADLQAALERAGYAVGEKGMQRPLEQWLDALQSVSAASEGPGDAALRVALAASLIAMQTGTYRDSMPGADFAMAWAQKIEEDPLSFFQAVKEAEVLAATVMLEVHAARIERRALEELVGTRNLMNTKSSQNKSDGGGMVRKAGATARVEAMFAERMAVLAVPYSDRQQVKDLGAVWYGPKSLWFVPKGLDITPFNQWNPRSQTLGPVATEEMLINSFRDEMATLGLSVKGEIKADGKWHNVAVDTKNSMRKNKSGSYILSLNGGRNGNPIGTIMNKDTGESVTWTHKGALLTPEQRARVRAEILAREMAAAQEMAKEQDVAAMHASEIWTMAHPADQHGYVIKKGIVANDLRQVSGSVLLQYREFKSETGTSIIRERDNYLIVPMKNADGKLRALQAISADGSVKTFMRGAQKKGTMLVLGAESFDELVEKRGLSGVAYAEGVATAASFQELSGLPTIVCFDAGNLETVVAETAAMLPASAACLLAVDNDQFHVERALGFLSDKLGLNPHENGGTVVSVMSGANSRRSLSLGEAIADGEWHQTAKGGYSMSLQREDECEAIRSVVVEVAPVGCERKMSATFVNRGLEAGRNAVLALTTNKDLTRQPKMVVPKFKSLVGKPTDWNDLVKIEGIDAARAGLPEIGVASWLAMSHLAQTSNAPAVNRASGFSR